ncbi:MAG: hypothetical protein RJA36_1498 [Pseudomonadota bacterium]|jgi:hypothetical protein
MAKPRAEERYPITEATVALSSLVPNPKNAKTHPREQLERLGASIREFGQPKRILVRAANKMIVAGHGVWEAMRLAGLSEINVALWEVPQRVADAFMLGDNRLADLGQNDTAKAAQLLREIDEELWLAVGYSDEEAEKEIAALEEQDVDVITIDTSAVDDQFWIVVKGPLAQQADALLRLQTVMGELPDVTVSIGTEEHEL